MISIYLLPAVLSLYPQMIYCNRFQKGQTFAELKAVAPA